MKFTTTLLITALLSTSGQAFAARAKGKMKMPDFTQGEKIPEDAKHDWNLGAIGARGWMYSDKMSTAGARQIAITQVEKSSPADGILAVGDVILGVGGNRFSSDPRTELGTALSAAESTTGGGKLTLTRWRDGKAEEVAVKLEVLGDYSATAPYDCPKSKRILERGCAALAKRMSQRSYKQNPITRSLNALALLASGDPAYVPLVKKEAVWAAGFSATSMQSWFYGYAMMLLSEYVMATGDESVMPGLRRLALETANGQSAVGSWGHKFAQPDGRLYGYGMMNSPGLPLTISLVMARAAGVHDPAVDRAIERSAGLMRFYIGKGAIPYGDHQPWTQTHDDNGKCGMAAVLFNLLGEKKGAEFFSRMSVASHGSERDGGHTGNFFNILWALPGVAQSGPNATGAWMKEFGSWYFDLARQWDGSLIHQGPPQMKNDSYAGWDCSGAYLLAYALPLKKIWLTGKRPAAIAALDSTAAQSLIHQGRGWSHHDRNSGYDGLSDEQLFKCLGSWSPIVRERVAMALSRRKEAPVSQLINLLDAPQIEARYGACKALELLKGRAAPAVKALQKTLQHDDLWLRVQAAYALAAIGDKAMSTVPELLERIAKGPTEADPRGMEQRYLCFAVFGSMLKKSLDGVDRDQVRKAVEAGLHNQDGKARGEIGGIYHKLSYEEIKPLMPAIQEAVLKPAPSGEMFASNIRLTGIELMAKHRIKEGMGLCFLVMDIHSWGAGARIPRCLNALASYGTAAKRMLPRLRELEAELIAHPKSKNFQSEIQQTRSVISRIEEASEPVELRGIQG
ncbi:MAG: hypothetical protein RLY69_139 [Verrucomicrobiota bacterium]